MSNSAALSLVIISDYECPACASFEATRVLLDTTDLAIHVIHLPIPRHRFARRSVAAAHCAEKQGRFAEFHRALFNQQDSIGLLQFAEFARRVGVPSMKAFEACLDAKETGTFVDSSYATALALGARGTPTIIVDGWRYSRTPVLQILNADMKRIRMGRPPTGVPDFGDGR